MNVRRHGESTRPDCPTRRRLTVARRALLVVVAAGVGALAGGCASMSPTDAAAVHPAAARDVPVEPRRSAVVPQTNATPPLAMSGATTCATANGVVPPGHAPVSAAALPQPGMDQVSEKAPDERLMIYVIQEGDTLSAIAERWMGGASHWPEIGKANPGLVPEKLKIGRAIRLPVAGATPGR